MKYLIIIIMLTSCGVNYKTQSGDDCPRHRRIGAKCKDGTSTESTGSGACSKHRGVKKWICE